MPRSRSSPIVHIGVVVPNIEVAREQLGAALGLTWGEVRHAEYGAWRMRSVTSYEGPPFLELQEGSPGSPWDARGEARLDHVQRWSPDRDADMAELTAMGMTVDVDGDSVGQPFCYVRTADGIRIELIDAAMEPEFKRILRIEDTDA